MNQKIPIDADGRFAGYASVFNALDEGGDGAVHGLLHADEPL